MSRASLRSSLVGNLKGKVEEFDGSVHVRLFLQINADPAAVGQDMVGFGAAAGQDAFAIFGFS